MCHHTDPNSEISKTIFDVKNKGIDNPNPEILIREVKSRISNAIDFKIEKHQKFLMADENKDKGCIYHYSGKTHYPQPWDPKIKKLRNDLNTFVGNAKFNSVLCNFYRNGQDYMGWHQDNEPELDINPIIASISLGAERKFSFRHKQTKWQIDTFLKHGSLLIMHSDSQINWEHSLPKNLKSDLPRINLTFRTIVNKKL